MTSRYRLPLHLGLLLAAFAIATPATATTYVPVSDAALVDRAVVIGTFEVLSSEPAATARPVTEYRVRAETLLKGDLRGGIERVRIPGGVSAGGTGVRFDGLPTFEPGESGVLLFLVPRHDGTWGIAHLLMGAFQPLERREGDLLLRPHLAEASRVGRGTGTVPGEESSARDRERFLDWIAARVAGRSRAADYWVPFDVAALSPRFTQFHDDDSGYPLRWFDFDSGGTVTWFSADQGPPGYPDQGVAAVVAGLAAWNHLAGTNIRLQYAGTRPIDSGFVHDDGVNEVLFNDPHLDIDEDFDCDEGGVLAIGGPYYDDRISFRHQNQNWHSIVEGAVVLNTNLACYLRGSTTRLAEVVGHELGHTIGLGHSCGDSHSPPCSADPAFDDALMRASVHNDGRGPRLGSDDIAGAIVIYGSAVPTGPEAPRAPNRLAAQLSGNDVTLTWNDRSNNEQGFRVYRALGNGALAQLGETGPGQATFHDLDVGAGSWSYEVRAFNQVGDSAPSNRVTVVIEALGVPGVAQLSASAYYGSEESGTATLELHRVGGKSGLLSVRLRTRDLSATAPLDYTARDLVVTWADGDDSPKIVDVAIVDDFEAEESELIEVLLETVPASGQAQGFPLGSAFAVISDDDGSPGCATGDRHLCLLGGRFKVEVEWRDQHSGGTRGFGHALVGSDKSGYFWFFNQENVELIAKAIDGRTVTGAHWLFYGALSDVEYWVTVTDTATGAVKLYHNAPGNICGVGDTRAFPQAAAVAGGAAELAPRGVPASPAASLHEVASTTDFGFSAEPTLVSRATCVPDAQTLCILGGRFQVRVSWRNHRTGATGVGTAIPYSDQSGFFWFFDADNIELVVKALDAHTLNGKFWFFYGALSDVEYTITVTDTVTNAVHSYNNAGGNICGEGDINAFPSN